MIIIIIIIIIIIENFYSALKNVQSATALYITIKAVHRLIVSIREIKHIFLQ